MRVPSSAAPDVQQSLRDVWDAIDRVRGPINPDLKGQRLTNAGRAISASDYVTKYDLDQAIAGVTTSTTTASGAPVTIGLHADRLGRAASPEGALYFETDRTVLYVARGAAWTYLAGVMRSSPGDLAIVGPPGPGTPAEPTPSDGAVNVSLSPLLTWTNR